MPISKRTLSGTMVLLFFMGVLTIFGCKKTGSDNDNPPTPGTVKPEIISINPARGVPGSTVTVTGRHFSPNPTLNKVFFKGALNEAEVISAAANELKVKVPPDAETGKIVVKLGNLGDTSSTEFIVDPEPASISGFSPTEGPFGTTVTITGRKFGNDVRVLINGIETSITSRSSTEIVIVIPNNTALTSHVLTVISDGATLQTTGQFTVTASGPYASWESRQVTFAPGASVFPSGLSFVYNNKIYWGFTGISFAESQADYVVFDPSRPGDGWVLQSPPPADMAPAKLQHAVALVHDNKVFIGTGLSPNATNTWWQFHPETNTSTRLTDYPEATAGALSFVVNNTMYVGFGGNNKTLYRFDPAANNGKGNWTPAATATFNSLHMGNAFVLGNDVFLGRVLPAVGQERKAIYRFNQPGQLTRVNDMPEDIQMNFTPAFTVGNKGYFIVNKRVWEYTPDATGGSWRTVISRDDAPVIRHVAVVTVSGVRTIYGWNTSGDLFEFKMNP